MLNEFQSPHLLLLLFLKKYIVVRQSIGRSFAWSVDLFNIVSQ